MNRCVVLLVVMSCAEADDGYSDFARSLDSILATISSNAGELTVKHAAQGVWEPCRTATPLYPGDWLRTGRGSWAHVEFVSGGALDVEEEAVVVIEALEALDKKEPDSPASAPLVAVQSGAIRSTLTDHAGRERPLLVRTAQGGEATVARRVAGGPAELRLASVKGETEVSVAKGVVEVTSQAKTFVVESGAAAVLSPKGVERVVLPKRPELKAPRSDARVRAGPVALSWQAADASAAFRVQVARDPAFRGLDQSGDASAPALEVDLKAGVYFWRVAANDASGRSSAWSAPRRLFAQPEAPTDALLEPAPAATFGYGDAPPRVAFKWSAKAEVKAYRLVVSRDAELDGEAVVSEVTSETEVRVDTLKPGDYFWGVYVQGSSLEPLFLEPRKLMVKKVAGGVQAPKHIRKWGE